MRCFNCDNDADMEVLMMINGKLKKINICMDCYKEQMQVMLEQIKDEDGNVNPDNVQKKMFEFFQNNKEEFEKFLGEAVGNQDFDISDLKPENFDISQMNFDNSGFNLNFENVGELFQNMMQDKDESKKMPDFPNFDRPNPTINKKSYYGNNESLDKLEKEIMILTNTVRRKRQELNEHLMNEDYIAAAISRDEMREINKKIMDIKLLVKEGETV